MITRTAKFSDCMAYRYELLVRWKAFGPIMTWLMMNPSTATEMKDDPTIKLVTKRAKNLGYSGIRILNVFAFRATKPEDMMMQLDPVGPKNNETIISALEKDKEVYCAWGNPGAHLGRDEEIRKMLAANNIKMKCIKINKTGQPVHPLFRAMDDKYQDYV